jgi:hypothetical protein
VDAREAIAAPAKEELHGVILKDKISFEPNL